MLRIQACTGNVSLLKVKGIKAVVAVHKGLKNRNSLGMNGHLAYQKLKSRGKLAAKDQSAGVEQVITLQKRALRRQLWNLQISAYRI